MNQSMADNCDKFKDNYPSKSTLLLKSTLKLGDPGGGDAKYEVLWLTHQLRKSPR